MRAILQAATYTNDLPATKMNVGFQSLAEDFFFHLLASFLNAVSGRGRWSGGDRALTPAGATLIKM
jgi:hypothetical protein